MLAPFTDPLLGNIKHGFFTRENGVSTGIYSSLNVGFSSKDNPENITKNREKICDYFNVNKLITAQQTHSNKAVYIDKPPTSTIYADALITKTQNLLLGVLTADCTPILFADPIEGIIAAAHAGRKGALSGIIKNTVKKMIDVGAQLHNIHAVIGPCISQAHYELDYETQKDFVKILPQDSDLFIPSERKNHVLFHLSEFIKRQLERSGVLHINHKNLCTYQKDSLFFSYRRMTHQQQMDYGRQISVITL